VSDQTLHVRLLRLTARELESAEALSESAAERIAAGARAAIEARGTFTIALAGGSTPARTYELLAERHRDDVPWDRVEVFFGDERCVPPDDADSNFALAWRTLLSKVPVEPGHVHPMYSGGELPEVAAARYGAMLQRRFASSPEPVRTFDITLLGMGEDGHTASLFPGSPSLDERDRWAMPVEAPATARTRQRITLTFPPIEMSREVMLLVAGAAKAPLVRAILGHDPDAGRYPASRARGAERTMWLLDHAAAAMIPR
jgi:6-phosphogluconolactonase